MTARTCCCGGGGGAGVFSNLPWKGVQGTVKKKKATENHLWFSIMKQKVVSDPGFF